MTDLPERVYLGDAVYAEERNGMVKLTTGSGYGAIYLEPEVFENLLRFVASLREKGLWR